MAGIVKVPPFFLDSLVNLVVLWRGPAPLPPRRCHPCYPCRPEFGQFQVNVQWVLIVLLFPLRDVSQTRVSSAAAVDCAAGTASYALGATHSTACEACVPGLMQPLQLLNPH